MAGWRQENWVLDFDGVRYEIESYVIFSFQLAAIFSRVSTCLKCLFRAVSSLDASLPPRSGRNKSTGFPQALLSPAVRYTVSKINASTSRLNNRELVELYVEDERPKAVFLQVSPGFA